MNVPLLLKLLPTTSDVSWLNCCYGGCLPNGDFFNSSFRKSFLFSPFIYSFSWLYQYGLVGFYFVNGDL